MNIDSHDNSATAVAEPVRAASIRPVERRESPVRRTALAGGLSVASLLIKIVINLLIIPISLFFLGPQEYGVWIVLQSLALLLNLSEAGVAQTVANFAGAAYARDDHRGFSEVHTTAFALYWMISLFVATALLLVIGYFPVHRWLFNEVPPDLLSPLRVALAITVILTAARIPTMVVPATLVGLRQMPLRVAYDIVGTLGLFAATIAVLMCGGGLIGLAIATNVVWIVVSVAIYLVLVRRYPFVRWRLSHFRPRLLRVLWSNSSFFLVISVALVLERSAGNLLVARFGTLGAVPGMFVMLTLFRRAGWSLINVFSHVLQPYVLMWWTHGDHQRVRFLAALSTKLSVAAGVLLTVPIFIWGKQVIDVLMGTSTFPGYGTMGCIAAVFLLDCLFLSAVNFLVVLNRHHWLAAAAAVKSLLALGFGGLGAVWLPQNPALGITAGFLVASIVGQALMLPRFIRKGLEIPGSHYWQHYVARPLLPIVPALGALWLLAGSRLSAATTCATATILAITIVALAWFAVLSRDERRWALNWMRRLGARFVSIKGAAPART